MTVAVSAVAIGLASFLVGRATLRPWCTGIGLLVVVIGYVALWFVDAPLMPSWVSWLLIAVGWPLGHVVRRERAKRAPGGSHP
jgi:hypothetical protein